MVLPERVHADLGSARLLSARTQPGSLTPMGTIYLSSTYEDLKDHREAVYRALRRLGHDVGAMEDYVATDQRPVDKCLADVAACDIYVGILAWRYGYVPADNKGIPAVRQPHDAAWPCLRLIVAGGGRPDEPAQGPSRALRAPQNAHVRV